MNNFQFDYAASMEKENELFGTLIGNDDNIKALANLKSSLKK
jgi:hypothetical protein